MPASAHPPPALVRLLSPPGVPGPIAIISLEAAGEPLEEVLARLGIAPPRVGEVVLRDLLGVDRGVVARFEERTCLLMPHGSTPLVRRLLERLARGGCELARDADSRWPEAGDDLEGRMLAALARAASPDAIDLLLRQPSLWRRAPREDQPTARDAILKRLIDPPLVVAVGPANIGKSTLLNTLARAPVAIVADEPGTTRDYVGTRLELGGLVVRYVDTPGLRAREESTPEEREGVELALQVARRADLLLLLRDPGSIVPRLLPGFGGSVLRVCLRGDLGDPGWPTDLVVSCATGQGLEVLVEAIREILVPRALVDQGVPWRFW